VTSVAGKAAAQDLVGRTLAGTYTLTRVLGVGGMGSVFEGVHGTTGKRVAIKVLAVQMSCDLKVVTRFRREAIAASRLTHENCIHVHDFGEDADGTFFIAMELIPGHGLADELRVSGPMPAERVARIGVQLLSALDAAHGAGVLHRDLKPQNVMLMQKPNRPDIVKVVDFGIAKLTTNEPGEQAMLTVPGTIFGTPEYMSPEQARGELLDVRSDLYSAAVVLWHMLLGRSPFRGISVRETLIKVFSEEPPSPLRERPSLKLPVGFEDVLRRALAKDKEARWPDAASFAAALARFADAPGLSSPAPRALPGLLEDGRPPPETLPAASPAAAAMSGGAFGGSSTGVSGPSAGLSPGLPAGPPARRTAGAGLGPTGTLVATPAAAVAGPGSSLAGTAVASLSALLPLRPETAPPAVAPAASSSAPGASARPPSPASPASLTPTAPEPSPETLPDVPVAAPVTTRLVTVESVQRHGAPPAATRSGPAATARMSVAAVILLVCGLALAVALVLLGLAALRRPAVSDAGKPPPAPLAASAPVSPTAAAGVPGRAGVLPDESRPVDPLARDAAIARAQRAVADGRQAVAREEFLVALHADPTAPAALIGLGTQAMQEQDWATARDCFARLTALDVSYRRQFGPMYARAQKLAPP